MPSENSNLDEDDDNSISKVTGIHMATDNFGTIVKRKRGLGPNGECFATLSAPSLTSILKKTKSDEGNRVNSMQFRKRGKSGTARKRFVKLAPKLTTDSQKKGDGTSQQAVLGPQLNVKPKVAIPLAPPSPSSSKAYRGQLPDASANMCHPEVAGKDVHDADELMTAFASAGNDETLQQVRSPVLPAFSSRNLPPKRFEIVIPAEGYVCQDCQDRFLLYESLKQHLHRRSVYISFDCTACKRMLAFYNRCSLLAHARDHPDVLVDLDRAVVEPLPHVLVPCVQESSARIRDLAMMGMFCASGSALQVEDDAPPPTEANATIDKSPSEANAPVNKTAILVAQAESSPSSLLLTPSQTIVTPHSPIASLPQSPLAQPISSISESKLPKVGDSLVRHYRCPECPQHFSRAASFHEHFSGDGSQLPAMQSSLQCRKCGMICTTKCSLEAHRRTHVQRRPYVCPECGQQIANTWAAFQRHVTYACFHPSRTVGFECPFCSALLPNPDLLRRHLDANHESESFVKCLACPLAFKSEEAFAGHRAEAHPLQPELSCGVIFKCPLCEVVFQKDSVLQEHVQGHFSKFLPLKMAKYLFRCPECSELVKNKVMLSEHMTREHRDFPDALPTKSTTIGGDHPNLGKAFSGDAEDEKATNEPRSSQSPLKSGSHGHCTSEAKWIFPAFASLSPDSELQIDLENGDHGVEGDMVIDEGVDEGVPPSNHLTGTYEQLPSTTENANLNGAVTKKRRRTPKKFECNKCGCSFRTRHWAKVHGERCQGSPAIRRACAVCQRECPDAHDMAVHGQEHLKEGTLVCFLCHNLPFTTKLALARHIENHALHYSYPYTCALCQEALSDVKVANLHWRSEHGLLSFHCTMCDVQYLYRKSLGRHIRDVHGDRHAAAHYSCAFCQEEGFETAEEAGRHVRRMHDVSEDKLDLAHMVKRKFKNPAFIRRRRTGEEGEATPPPPQPPPERILPPIPKLTIKIEPADEAGDEGLRSDGSTASSLKHKRPKLSIKKEEEYRCAKCERVDSDRRLFVEHVESEHKTDADCVQCLECGTCFAVEASLRRHLIFGHRVKDVDKFLLDKGYNLKAAEIELVRDEDDAEQYPGVEGLPRCDASGVDVGCGTLSSSDERMPPNPLECRVCFSAFVNELALKVHSRTHGMAFIRSKAANVSKNSSASEICSPKSC